MIIFFHFIKIYKKKFWLLVMPPCVAALICYSTQQPEWNHMVTDARVRFMAFIVIQRTMRCETLGTNCCFDMKIYGVIVRIHK